MNIVLIHFSSRITVWLLTVLLLTGSLAGCGGDDKGDSAVQDGGSNRKPTRKVAYGGSVTITVTDGAADVKGKVFRYDKNHFRAPGDRGLEAGGACELDSGITAKSYGFYASDGSQRGLLGVILLTPYEYAGPGTYPGGANWALGMRAFETSLQCSLTIGQDERSGTFQCTCTSSCTPEKAGDIGEVKTIEGSFQCAGEFEEVDL
ncbi:MAG: hypothetical protein HYY13_11100 [Nitrospirae bacterium]|nr:hypothetical protein [Nitrospirota bacterium]